MLASNESFYIFVVIAAVSALFNWIKKRGESDDWSSNDLPTPTRRTPPGRPVPPQMPSQPKKTATNWEEELRRMLEGAVPTTQQPAPPPIIAQERRTPPSLPRQPASRPEPVETPAMALPKTFEERFYKAHCNYCGGHIEFPASAMEEVVPCPHCQRPTVLRPFEQTAVEALAHQHVLADFSATEKSYEAASHLSERVSAHMHAVGYKPVGSTSIHRTKTLWPEVAKTKALFQNARTMREAMIASLILGPPKSLED